MFGRDEKKPVCVVVVDPGGYLRTLCEKDVKQLLRFESLIRDSKGACLLEFDKGEVYSVCDNPQQIAEAVKRLAVR